MRLSSAPEEIMPIQIQSVLCGEIGENAWIVWREGRDDCVVIDPGDEYPKLKRAIGGKRVAAILLTHGHFDHIMAVGAMAADTRAPVYIAAEDMEMLDNPVLNGGMGLMGVSRMEGPAIAARPFDGELSAAGLDFEIIPTPGHSRGSVCLYLPDEGMLFSGDTLFNAGFGRMDLHGGSPRQMRESLRRLFSLPAGVRVYPGHGTATTIGDERSRYKL